MYTQALISDTKQKGYIDSDFMGDLDKRLSLTDYVFTLGRYAISWKATLQSTIGLSSTKAEYMALTEGTKEAIWLKGSLEDISTYGDPTTIYGDNQSVVHLAKDQIYHERSKHIDVKFLFCSTCYFKWHSRD